MPPFAKFHPATLTDLNKWSTLSRNEIGRFLAQFRIKPLNSKYPMLRVYEGVLGLSPSGEGDEAAVGQGLIRTTEVAGMVGLAPDDLLQKLRAKNNDYPPLYVFGPRRHLMLRAQVEQMLGSSRNAWQAIAPLANHSLPASRLARFLKVRQSRIDTLLENRADLPAHIITHGRIRYIVADVERRLTSSNSEAQRDMKDEPQDEQLPDGTSDAVPPGTPSKTGGLFSEATQHPNCEANRPRSCTGSGANAHRGECLHGVPAEAKHSEI